MGVSAKFVISFFRWGGVILVHGYDNLGAGAMAVVVRCGGGCAGR